MIDTRIYRIVGEVQEHLVEQAEALLRSWGYTVKSEIVEFAPNDRVYDVCVLVDNSDARNRAHTLLVNSRLIPRWNEWYDDNMKETI